MTQLCSDVEMAQLIRDVEQEADDIGMIDRCLASYPADPRLHFMRGSVLAGKGRPIEAHAALTRAVDLAPDFALARYQLGFFELTSGQADQALSIWGPLLKLPLNHYLRNFVEGLTHLIRDEFEAAIAKMEDGIRLNQENAPMNNDIRLLITECQNLQRGTSAGSASSTGEEVQSATSFILGQLSVDGPTRH